MTSKTYHLIFITFVSLIMLPSVIAAVETSFSHPYPPVEWSYGGNEIPETYWTPYLPLGAQEFTRFRIGFRFSTGTIVVKCPVKLTFKYDTNNAQSGKDLPIKVKAELIGADYKTFESAFGLNLPNEFQVGFIGITGIPDILPWFTLPWDLCGILSHIPGLPHEVSQKITLICRAIDNVGVNMETKDALPLPGVASYHDKRTLFEFKLSDLCANETEKIAFKNNLGISIFNGLSNRLGTARMGKLILFIQGVKNLNEAGATEFLTDKCISAAGGIMSFASISAVGDPYFSVEGVELIVNLRAYIPNGKGSGTYPVTFTSSGQEQTVTFRDITPFVQTGDKLVIVADSIAYRFKLKQGLIPKVGISIKEFSIDSSEKYITLATAKKDFSESEFKGEIPLVPSTDPIQSLRAQPGCTSAQVNWTSPIVPLKGTIKVYQGNTLVKTVAENTFRPNHNNIITDLTKQTTYRFELSGITESGQTIEGGSVTATTQEYCRPRNQDTTCNSLTFSSTPTATAGQNYADFSWTTNERASTMVLISPSPDMSANYIACAKKEGGQTTQGWVTQGGVMELVTNHSIRVADLEPGTKYYYNVVSWTYKNNNPTDDPINRVGYVSEITTEALPAQPSARISVISQYGLTEANVTVNITKVGDPSYHCAVVTGSNGQTQPVLFEPGKMYIFKVSDNACYQDYTSSPTMVVPVGAQGERPPFSVGGLVPRPPLGAYVYDTQGRPISGAMASYPGFPPATTDASGHYSFGQFNPTGDATITITKAGYMITQVAGKVGSCGRLRTLTIDNCVLRKSAGMINVSVKKQDGSGVAGAQVAAKEGSVTKVSVLTDSQGNAGLMVNFSDNLSHDITVTATPPASLAGADPATENTKLAAEGQQNVYLTFIVAPPDTQGPVISDVNFTQPNSNTIGISFKSNEEVSTVSLEYKFPNGQIKNTSWYTYNSSAFLGSVAAGYKTMIGDTSIVGGTYTIRIKCKDRAGNQSESGPYNFTMFGDALWGFKSSAVGTNSITLSWNKYPHATDFAKYILAPATGSVATFAQVEILNINQTSHTLTGLSPNTNYTITLNAQSQTAGWPLTSKATLNVKTVAPALPAPVIRGFEPNPIKQEVNKNITVTAQITDSDSQIKKVILRATYVTKDTKKESQIATQDYNTNSINYSHTFTLNQPGSYYLTLEAKDESSATEKTIEYEVLPASGPSKEEEALQKKEEEGALQKKKEEEALQKKEEEELKKKGEEEALQKKEEEALALQKKEEEALALKKKEEEALALKKKEGEALQETESTKGDISLAVQEIKEPVYARQKIAVSATIKNDSKSNITGGRLKFYIDDKPYGSPKTFALKAGETRKVDVSFTPLKTGTSVVKWELVLPENFTNDSVPENNLVKQSINVLPKPQPQGSTQTEQVQDVNKPTLPTKKTKPAITLTPVDLAVLSLKADANVPAGKQMTIEASVKNNSNLEIDGANVTLYVGTLKKGEQIVKLKADETQKVTFTYTPPNPATLTLKVKITCPKGFKDTDTKNDIATQKVQVVAAKEGEEEKKP